MTAANPASPPAAARADPEDWRLIDFCRRYLADEIEWHRILAIPGDVPDAGPDGARARAIHRRHWHQRMRIGAIAATTLEGARLKARCTLANFGYGDGRPPRDHDDFLPWSLARDVAGLAAPPGNGAETGGDPSSARTPLAHLARELQTVFDRIEASLGPRGHRRESEALSYQKLWTMEEGLHARILATVPASVGDCAVVMSVAADKIAELLETSATDGMSESGRAELEAAQQAVLAAGRFLARVSGAAVPRWSMDAIAAGDPDGEA